MNGEGFVVKIRPDGSRVAYGTYLPVLGAIALAVDSNGSAYAAGYVEAPQINFQATAGAFQTSSSATATGLIAKLNPAGSALVYATYLGGTAAPDQTYPNGIAADSSGDAYITGRAPADSPVTAGAISNDFERRRICGQAECGRHWVGLRDLPRQPRLRIPYLR
jgi:hypothetical protein